jgi:hypothetical protein
MLIIDGYGSSGWADVIGFVGNWTAIKPNDQ